MQFRILLFLIFYYGSIQSQSLMQIQTDSNSGIQFLEIVGFNSYGNLSAVPGSKTCAVNVINNKSQLAEALILQFQRLTDIKSAQRISQKSGSIQIKKILSTNPDEVFFMGTYLMNGIGNYCIIGVYNLKIKSLTYVKILSDLIEPNKNLSPIDVISNRGIYYLLLSSEINYLGASNSKIVIVAFDGTQVLWSKIYNSLAPIHSEAPGSLAIGPNGTILISGTIKSFGDNFYRMMLAEVSLEGEPVALKMIELLSADQQYNHRYGFTAIKPKGANIFMFSQSVVGRSEPGPLLITWFDASLTLRTWRNYDAPIRVEHINADGFYFYAGGQAPVESGYEGYALMKINSTNAIVEQFKYFKESLDNSSIATSSAICFDRANDKTWTMIKPNGSTDNYIMLLENEGLIEHDCSEEFSYIVAKDPIIISDIVFNAKSQDYQLADLDCSLEEINITATEKCQTTATESEVSHQVSIFPNPSSQQVSISTLLNMDLIQMFDLNGSLVAELKPNSKRIDLNLTSGPGIYYVKVWLANKRNLVKKLLVIN